MDLAQKTKTPKSNSLFKSGFTIVEILVVVVVVGILATISIVTYSGIQSSAAEVVLKSDLKQASTQLALLQLEDGEYPRGDTGLPKSEDTNYTYISDGSTYCLAASSEKATASFYVDSENGTIQEGTCTPSVATIQSFTSQDCNNLTTYTGNNEAAVITLHDPRGEGQDYQVAKLADNNCWMLNNLKLGSIESSITLTPGDSNVATNFTLPQLTTTGAGDHDNPRAYGPVPGDTSEGATNYGYLYNWSAATAGESRASHPQNAGNAPYSICPAGWRLPSGSATLASSDFAQLDIAFGGTGSYASGGPSLPSWQPTGPFKGSFSGLWGSSFLNQGSDGVLWSSSARPGYSDDAFGAYFNPSLVISSTSNVPRNFGSGIRCLLN